MKPLYFGYFVVAIGVLAPLADLVVVDRASGISECYSMTSHQQRNQCLFGELEKEQQRADILRSMLK